MNILSDFEIRLNNLINGDPKSEVNRLSQLLKEKEELIIQYANELNKSEGSKKPVKKGKPVKPSVTKTTRSLKEKKVPKKSSQVTKKKKV